MNFIYATKIGLEIEKTNIIDQKIDSSFLKTYNMVIAVFYIFDKFGCL